MRKYFLNVYRLSRHKFCGAWSQNFTEYFERIHNKICILRGANSLKNYNMLKLWHLKSYHDDVIKWKHFPRYWPFVRGIHRSPVNSPHKGQRRGALMFTLICARINGWVNNREAGDISRYCNHYDVIVMLLRQAQDHQSDVNNKTRWPLSSLIRTKQPPVNEAYVILTSVSNKLMLIGYRP